MRILRLYHSEIKEEWNRDQVDTKECLNSWGKEKMTINNSSCRFDLRQTESCIRPVGFNAGNKVGKYESASAAKWGGPHSALISDPE